MNGDRVQRFAILVAILGLTFEYSHDVQDSVAGFADLGIVLVLIGVTLGAVGLFPIE